ncbi:sulfate/molybdate ABC transporter ATP-binding protein [Aureibacillus halotolerans]|uniref:Sulfate transport system ATP-binding protein n=1 Tax=Aureibacillus halotolerans TaxID=1508390 RepID=A0A4R6U8Y8_9BACI|nr:sulfate/molybdate ABC transporter ATP-binding protein [Aureibacillus halotolerans]TDQ42881.1 sulfate transport system ATP-binding protein [Aureibacillus halotolerans]
MSITVEKISKSFGSFQALHGVDLTVQEGELLALLGPSGSGKTSLLRIIAGLEHSDQGSISFHGQEQTNTHVSARNVGFVFQHYALFRHMTVAENVAYGLKVRPKKQRPSKNAIKEKVDELLALIKLEGYADRYPAQLSGGQRQRVALARALAVEPSVLLLDEPFGALDAKVRKELRLWLRNLHQEFNTTSVFVTHDQEEAFDVADRVAIMNEGRIIQLGRPDEVYHSPNSPFVFDFLGRVNTFSGPISDRGVEHGSFVFRDEESGIGEGQRGIAYVRPHHFTVTKESRDKSIPGIIHRLHRAGPLVSIEINRLDVASDYVQVELTELQSKSLHLSVGDTIYLYPEQCRVFSVAQ